MLVVQEEGKRKKNQEFKNLKTDSLEDHCQRGGMEWDMNTHYSIRNFNMKTDFINLFLLTSF